MNRLLIVLACALALVACTDEAPEQIDGGNGGVAHRTDPQAVCDNESSVVDSTAVPTEGVLTGDVDGDDVDDTIYIAIDDDAAAGCRSFIVVSGEGTIYSAPLDPSGTQRGLPEPSLQSVIELDHDPGKEIVVNLESGASTQFVGVFKVTADGLERITLDGRAPGPFAQDIGDGDLFASGGSVGHLDAVDCLGPELIVMSAAIPVGDSAERYEVERRFFRLDGTELSLQSDSTEVHEVEGLTVERFREFAGSPFGSCI